MARRSRAREAAFQILYQADLNPSANPGVRDQMLQETLGTDDLVSFARSLLAGVRRHRSEIDALIEDAAQISTRCSIDSLDRLRSTLGLPRLSR